MYLFKGNKNIERYILLIYKNSRNSFQRIDQLGAAAKAAVTLLLLVCH
jgi:hypothetical protein